MYLRGLELGNGYHELCDPDEHLQRFALENHTRRALGLPELPNDARLLAAVRAGLPDCAGVALGIDRLVMLAAKARGIEEVVAFPIGRA